MRPNNNKWRWWMWMVAYTYIGGLTAQVGWFGLGPGGWRPPGAVCIHQMKQVNSRNGFGHDDSTINIGVFSSSSSSSSSNSTLPLTQCAELQPASLVTADSHKCHLHRPPKSNFCQSPTSNYTKVTHNVLFSDEFTRGQCGFVSLIH